MLLYPIGGYAAECLFLEKASELKQDDDREFIELLCGLVEVFKMTKSFF